MGNKPVSSFLGIRFYSVTKNNIMLMAIVKQLRNTVGVLKRYLTYLRGHRNFPFDFWDCT